MVIHFLQSAVIPKVLPCLHNLRPDKFNLLHDISTIDVLEHINVEWQSENERPIGELFSRFLDYYSNFDYAHNVISVRTGGTLSVEHCKLVRTPKNDSNDWQTLCIEEPFDLTNTARSTYDWKVFAKIKNAFFQSWRRLNETKDLNAIFKNPLYIKEVPRQQQVFFLNYFEWFYEVLYSKKIVLILSTVSSRNSTIEHFSIYLNFSLIRECTLGIILNRNKSQLDKKSSHIIH